MPLPPTPKRMTLGNLDDGSSITAQYNPTKVEVGIAVAFNKATIPGQSYQEQQYANTGNPTISFELIFDGRSKAKADLRDVENYLFALMYPPLKPGSVSSGAPPRVLFAWPGWIALVTTLPKFTQTSSRFSFTTGEPDLQTYRIDLEGRLTRRIGREEIRRSALKRSS